MPQRAETPITVSAPAGRITGLAADGFRVFRGVRFAEAPTGSRRFAAPVDAAPVEAIDATRWGAISLQDIDPLPRAIPGTENNFYAPGIVTSEDCLNLNVWAPSFDDAAPGDGAPVLVWIHGGAYMYGSGTGPWTDGARFARDHGIVVVSINYRLGLLGNLWLGDIEPTASDLAIQDQISALRWVQRNIAAFGGDPTRVTIAGQSAGGMSVASLMTAPAARGLFSGALVESGHVAAGLTVPQAIRARDLVLRALSVDPDGDLLEQLRALSTLRILQVQREFGIGIRAFPLVADDVVLPSDMLGAVRGGSADGVAAIIGTTAEEDRLFSITGWADETATLRDVLRQLLGGEVDLADAEALYADVPGTDRDRQFVVNTDHGWGAPARALATAHAEAGNPTFHYEYARRSDALDGRVGAAHLSELPVFWGNLDAPGVPSLVGEGARGDAALFGLAERVSGTIARFVTSGSPDGGPLGAWPPYRPDDRATRVIDVESRVAYDHKAARLDFWDRHQGVAALSVMSELAE